MPRGPVRNKLSGWAKAEKHTGEVSMKIGHVVQQSTAKVYKQRRDSKLEGREQWWESGGDGVIKDAEGPRSSEWTSWHLDSLPGK